MLIEKLSQDLKDAMKAGKVQKRDTIRGLQSAIKNKRIEKMSDLTEEEQLAVVAKEIKNRKKAIELFKQGNRQDLIDQYEKEIAILEPYSQNSM
ncbi:MAG: GatB/YqeY domain-containing protein [Patescibacteria group bacterium]